MTDWFLDDSYADKGENFCEGCFFDTLPYSNICRNCWRGSNWTPQKEDG